ncbi:GATA zinc finger domain-containing protein 14 [Condylostylus longicornis]|uniref:GATA zinc finger domain-containing protein 14 n=1 Tax=Condylostylus longicornis TaxID=2530218 RepID=UPI00244E448E|nr:GATA zinc finger domain-containing protein 14 [Condylostylus longicornis]
MAKEVEPEEIIRLIDGVYKSIIEKFNPCARQLITAGKAYLKALQGSASASNVFIETLNKIAVNAQHGTSSDIGDALINVVNVHKAIQEQHINILKAFYVDLLMPLENNLEKDTKVVQVEQKKFLQQHKANVESYCKAVTTLKKQRKKKNASGTTSKELKSLQAVEEQKNKLKTYCNQSLKNALTQERRRYGFVLERQCSIAKHWMSYHNSGKTLFDNNIDDWQQIAATRENIDLNLHELFSKNKDGNKSDLESNSLLLRKTRSMEVAGGPDNKRDDRSFNQNSLPRTKSEHNLTSSSVNHHRFSSPHSEELVEELLIMKAVYTYEANGKNQLNFEEGDRIALIGGRVNGWQFGENLRTKQMGWFPVTYLEKDNNNHHYHQHIQQHNQYQKQNQQHHNIVNNNNSNNINNHNQYNHDQTPMSTLKRGIQNSKSTSEMIAEPSPTRMFGDTIQFRNTRYFQKISAADLRTSPPPALPPPIPSGSGSSSISNANHLNTSQSFNFPKESHNIGEKKRPIIYKANKPFPIGHNNSEMEKPPPQPEVDYSDEEEVVPTRVPLRQHQNNDNDNTIKRPLSSILLYDDGNSSTRNSSPQHHSNNNNNNYHINNNNNITNNNLADIDLNTLTRKDNFIKRTKSFWKSKKYDENQINNLSSWRHEDIMMNQKDNNSNQNNNDIIMKNNNDSEYENDNIIHNNKNLNNGYSNSPKQQYRHLKQISGQQKQRNKNQQDNNNNKNNNKKRNNKNDSKTVSSMNFDNNNHNHHNHHHSHNNNNNFDSDDSDNSTIKMSEINSNHHNKHNFDDDSNIGLIKKPFKRREILKQYYNSDDEDDIELNNNNNNNNHNNHHQHHHINNHTTNHNNINENNINNNNNNLINDPDDDDDDDDNDVDNDRDDTDDDRTDTEHDNDTTISDPYDCIVIDDHLVKTKMEFKTFKGENYQNQNQKQQQQQQHQQQQHQKRNKNKRNDHNEHNNINNNKNSNNNNNTSNNNHNNNKNINNNSPSGTLLPRTKLNKTSSKENHLNRTMNQSTTTTTTTSSSLLLQDNNKMMINDNNHKNNGFINKNYHPQQQQQHLQQHHNQEYSDDSYSKSYGPWYDLWDDKSHHAAKS